MKISLLINTLLAYTCLTLFSGFVQAQSSDTLKVEPFIGSAGFQEINLENEGWYLAFHGTRNHTIESVNSGWLLRASELCEMANKPYIVELRYIGQQVFEDDPIAIYQEVIMQKVARAAYIPIYIPSRPRQVTPLETPTKAAPIRCVLQATGLKSGLVALPVAMSKVSPNNTHQSSPN